MLTLDDALNEAPKMYWRQAYDHELTRIIIMALADDVHTLTVQEIKQHCINQANNVTENQFPRLTLEQAWAVAAPEYWTWCYNFSLALFKRMIGKHMSLGMADKRAMENANYFTQAQFGAPSNNLIP
jgi:hypothetical protein